MSNVLSRSNRRATGRALLGGVMLACLFSAAASGQTWTGPTAGDVDWNTPAYWTGGDVPDTVGALAIINNTLTGNRTITTPASTLTMTRLTWEYKAGATGVDTLKLGGNLLMDETAAADRQNYFLITNAGTAANMVVDLAGHQMSLDNGLNYNTLLSSAVTVQSSAAGGVIAARTFGTINPDAHIGDGILVRNEGNAGVGLNVSGHWSPTATLQISNSNAVDDRLAMRGVSGSWGAGPGSLIIGDAANLYRTIALMQFENPRVQGDVTILGTTTPGVYSMLGWREGRTMYVGGNFTDLGTGVQDYYYYNATSRGTIVFDGGIASERTLSVGRTGLTKTGFRVGDTAVIPGNVKLEQDLTTQDDFTVTSGSRLNLATATLTSGTFTGQSGITLATTFGDQTGTVVVTNAGGLALNGFDLQLEKVGNWVDGSDLVLFTYSGTLGGTPALGTVTGPAGMSHGGLLTDGGTVRLANVSFLQIPEPVTAALLGGGMLLAALRRRR